MNRIDKIKVCQGFLEGSQFSVRANWFGGCEIRSNCGVLMCDYENLYGRIFYNEGPMEYLEHALETHNQINKERDERKKYKEDKEQELKKLYLKD